MTARNTSELLYDAEAALRQVDSAIAEICDAGSSLPENAGACALDPAVVSEHRALGIVDLTHMPARGYGEIVSVLGASHESRSALEHATVDHLRQTHARLREMTTVTGTAARSILAGFER